MQKKMSAPTQGRPLYVLCFKTALFRTLSQLLRHYQQLRDPVTLTLESLLDAVKVVQYDSQHVIIDGRTVAQILTSERTLNSPYRLSQCHQLVQLHADLQALCSARLETLLQRTISAAPDPGPQLLKSLTALLPYLPVLQPSILHLFQGVAIQLMERLGGAAKPIFVSKEFFQVFREARMLADNSSFLTPQQWASVGQNVVLDLGKSVSSQLYKECVAMLDKKYRWFETYSKAVAVPSDTKEGPSYEQALWLSSMKAKCYTLTRVINKIEALTSFQFTECCQCIAAIQMRIQNPQMRQCKTQCLDGYLTFLRYLTLQLQRLLTNVLSLPDTRDKRGAVQLVFVYLEELIGTVASTKAGQNPLSQLLREEPASVFNLPPVELKGYYERMLANIVAKLVQLRSETLRHILKEYSPPLTRCAKFVLEDIDGAAKGALDPFQESYKVVQESTYFPKELIGLRKGRERLILMVVSKFVRVLRYMHTPGVEDDQSLGDAERGSDLAKGAGDRAGSQPCDREAGRRGGGHPGRGKAAPPSRAQAFAGHGYCTTDPVSNGVDVVRNRGLQLRKRQPADPGLQARHQAEDKGEPDGGRDGQGGAEGDGHVQVQSNIIPCAEPRSLFRSLRQN